MGTGHPRCLPTAGGTSLARLRYKGGSTKFQIIPWKHFHETPFALEPNPRRGAA